jgi:hypothetical protein
MLSRIAIQKNAVHPALVVDRPIGGSLALLNFPANQRRGIFSVSASALAKLPQLFSSCGNLWRLASLAFKQ